jgi:predicted dehydrogenase
MSDKKKIRWGIIGCGHIAKTFTQSFKASKGGYLKSCAASDVERAQNFAAEHGIRHVHASYQALVADSDIDVIYIATTHNFHFAHIMLCLENNKHVLCEKPLTINAKQALQVKKTAEAKGLLVLEAVWTRFLPAIDALKQSLAEGAIGPIKSMYANFSLNRIMADEHRLLNPRLAGGALLDLGIYPITMADIVFDEIPEKAIASAIMTHTGVDEVSNYLLSYMGGKTALLSAGFRQAAPTECLIYGEKGYIRVPHFLGAKGYEICLDGQATQHIQFDYVDEHKFSFEINHVNKCLQDNKSSSELLPLSKSLQLIELMDDLRGQFNLVYPED